MKAKRYFSSGGGVQSSACLVLSAQGKINFPVHVFANVGDRAESPETIEYVNSVLMPYAKANGIEWVEVSRKDSDGNPIDLLDYTLGSKTSIPIPARMVGSGAPGRRSCTTDWKIKPVAKYLRSQVPASVKSAARRTQKSGRAKVYQDLCPIYLGKGISTDEISRASSASGCDYYQVEYPLIELNLSREDCLKIVKDAGLPTPPKSSCWFCPFKRFGLWEEMSTQSPALFQKACDLERTLHDRSQALGRGGVLFTNKGVIRQAFLSELIDPNREQLKLFETEEDLSFCESGFCMT